MYLDLSHYLWTWFIQCVFRPVWPLYLSSLVSLSYILFWLWSTLGCGGLGLWSILGVSTDMWGWSGPHPDTETPSELCCSHVTVMLQLCGSLVTHALSDLCILGKPLQQTLEAHLICNLLSDYAAMIKTVWNCGQKGTIFLKIQAMSIAKCTIQSCWTRCLMMIIIIMTHDSDLAQLIGILLLK